MAAARARAAARRGQRRGADARRSASARSCSRRPTAAGSSANPDGPEIGAQLIAKRTAAATDPLFGPLPITPGRLQWHFDAITALPPGAIQLASSPVCENQAFRLGRLAWGIQFHIETTPELVRDWAARGRRRCSTSYDLDLIVEPRATPSHDDIAEVWRAVRRTPSPHRPRPGARCRAPRGVPTSTAAPVTDPAAIRAALAAEAHGRPRSRCRCPALRPPRATEPSRPEPGRGPADPALLRRRRAAPPSCSPPTPLRWWDARRATSRPTTRRRSSSPRSAAPPTRTPRSPRSPSSSPRPAGAALRAALETRAASCAPGCSRCSGVSIELAAHLRAHPDDWQVLLGELDADGRAGAARRGGRRRRRPTRSPAPAAPRASVHRPGRRRRAARRLPARAAGRSPGATSPASSTCAWSPSCSPTSPGTPLQAALAVAAAGLPDGRRAVPARDHRDGQDRLARAELRLRRRRRLRRRAGRRRTATSTRALATATQAGRRDDAALPRGGVGGRRQPAARGQGRRARAHAGQPRGVLPALGQHLGVPGAAQGPAGRRRPRARAAPTRRRSRRWCGRRPSGPDFVADVRAMRRRVRRAHPGRASRERDIKLGRGGLRDVEFAVQLLQLVHGRGDESLRVPETLPALDALRDGGYVGRDDAVSLIDAYRFLRAIEHRLQLRRLRRTHVLPDDPEQLLWLAPRDGLPARPARRRARGVRGRVATCTRARCGGCTRSCSTGRCSRRSRGCRPRGCG